MAKRIDVIVLGRHLGTATGWDGDSGERYWFYNFQPAHGVDLQSGELQIDEITGYIGNKCDEDTGHIIEPKDICQFLVGIPRKED